MRNEAPPFVLAAALLALLALASLSACAEILGIREPEPEAFPHRAHVLEGIACVKCHADITTAGETGPLHMPTNESCLECHEDPHDASPCNRCHTLPMVERRAVGNRQHILFRHDAHLGREGTECVDCHAGIAAEGADLEATMGTCFGCHAHRDQFRVRQCEACHVDLEAERAVPESHLVHGERFLSTHGAQAASAGDLCTTCHTETFCARCHGQTTAALPERLSFDDPFTPGVHRAGFFARHALESAASPGLCATCHQESFCSACHARQGVDAAAGRDLSPHPAGWVGALQNLHGPAARRDPLSCAGCHGGAGEMLCVECHRVGGVGGSPHPPGWSSDRSRFELPCRLCHLAP
jgi:hypothetical protein